MPDGARDVRREIDSLASRLPSALAPLARLAYNYRWSWTGGDDLFRSIDPHRWELCRGNPVRLLEEVRPAALARAAADSGLVARIRAAAAEQDAHVALGAHSAPIAFLCAEFAIHQTLPIYSGGLGVLAGDVLKEASDRGAPMVGVGLLYRQGYFRQRIDLNGWQHEWWSHVDPERLPAALVTTPEGPPLVIQVPVRGRFVATQVWRVDVGRVPLYLLDTERPENLRADRWITSRLYVADRPTRMAQYALLGRGGILALAAMGIDPAVVHLNEGHAALAPLELARGLVDQGVPLDEALQLARRRTVFTTHTPVAAGNESFDSAQMAELLGDLPQRIGVARERLVALGRTDPDNQDEPFGLTPLGIRMSARTNGVSRRHGRVSRAMWQRIFPDAAGPDDVPIGHVTNGVHLPTWVAPEVAGLLVRHLGPDWATHASDAERWRGLERVGDDELWEMRRRLREQLVAYVRDRSVADRLARGEPGDYIEAAARAFSPDVLTIGFARRLATYKRLNLIVHDTERALRLLRGDRPVQIVLAGKAHPQDDAGKGVLQALFGLRHAPDVAAHVTFLEDYHLGMAQVLTAGCDVWVNLPRFPLEACGTSGMKAAANGCLNLSVRDGWWEEAFDGANGWAIGGEGTGDGEWTDAADAEELYRVLEQEIVPLFYDRDESGIPRRWVERIRASMVGLMPRFSAARMLDDYARDVYGVVAQRVPS